MNFKELKKNRKDSMQDLQKRLEEAGSGKKDYKDDRFWKLTTDKADNGFAVIRFLPSRNSDVPFIKYFDHGFQGPGGWYIEKSLTSIGQPDPVSELNSVLWNKGDKETARKQKRRLHYVSNIEIIKDPANPENEGKVFLFEFGVKIYEKIEEAITPPFDEQGRSVDHPDYDPTNALNPFDMWEGAPFTLTARKVNGFRNYESSKFGTPGPVAASDAEIEAIFNQTYDVSELLDPKNFKTRAELEARLTKVLGPASGVVSAPQTPAPSAGKTESAPEINEVSDDDDEFNLDELMKDI